MSGKKSRRKTNKRRSRRMRFGRMAAAVVCAAAVCAVIVCVAVFGRDGIIRDRNNGQTAEDTQMDNRQETPGAVKEQETPFQESDTLSPAVGPETDENPVAETDEDSVAETDLAADQEAEESAETTVSIIGDSISTFRGYIPPGYYDFFPENGLVSDVDDTWWKRVLDEKGWTLCVNASSSGAACVGDSTGTSSPQCGCNEFRIGGLAAPDGTAPDVIIVYMGTNDFLDSVPLGDNDGTRPVAEGLVSTFGDAYTLMLDKLQARYPSAKIYCCTITQVGVYGIDTPFVELVNGQGLTVADYGARIAQIAGNKNLPVIDLYTCGITVENLHNTTADGLHPTPEGMKYIAEAVGKVLD